MSAILGSHAPVPIPDLHILISLSVRSSANQSRLDHASPDTSCFTLRLRDDMLILFSNKSVSERMGIGQLPCGDGHGLGGYFIHPTTAPPFLADPKREKPPPADAGRSCLIRQISKCELSKPKPARVTRSGEDYCFRTASLQFECDLELVLHRCCSLKPVSDSDGGDI